jgi:hypothetical protein
VSSDQSFRSTIPFVILLLFPGLWLIVTSLLGLLSGWYALMLRYPDTQESTLFSVNRQSGVMGQVVSMSRILRLEVCSSGIRVGVMRLFGPFCRDFLVPWGEIAIVRKDRFLWQAAELRFGIPPIGRLSIAAHVANRLARAASPNWPEPGPFPEESKSQAIKAVFKEWFMMTSFAALFFIIAPRLIVPRGQAVPPVSVAILFPAVVVGFASLFRFLERTKK